MSVLNSAVQREAEIRHQLAVLARKPGGRTVVFLRDRPTKWQPTQVLNLETGFYYSDAGAWELIADQIDAGVSIDCVKLEKPLGATAYSFLIQIDSKRRPIYVKLQLGAGVVIGRSFHYSDY